MVHANLDMAASGPGPVFASRNSDGPMRKLGRDTYRLVVSEDDPPSNPAPVDTSFLSSAFMDFSPPTSPGESSTGAGNTSPKKLFDSPARRTDGTGHPP